MLLPGTSMFTVTPGAHTRLGSVFIVLLPPPSGQRLPGRRGARGRCRCLQQALRFPTGSSIPPGAAPGPAPQDGGGAGRARGRGRKGRPGRAGPGPAMGVTVEVHRVYRYPFEQVVASYLRKVTAAAAGLQRLAAGSARSPSRLGARVGVRGALCGAGAAGRGAAGQGAALREGLLRAGLPPAAPPAHSLCTLLSAPAPELCIRAALPAGAFPEQ